MAMDTQPVVGWEYKIVKVGPSTSLMSESLLNDLGRAGWDLVAFQPFEQGSFPGEGAFYLKRQQRSQGHE
jgi:hypothetical protein